MDPVPGRPNSYVPGRARASALAPTIVFRDGKPWFVLGAPGGWFGSVSESAKMYAAPGPTLTKSKSTTLPKLGAPASTVLPAIATPLPTSASLASVPGSGTSGPFAVSTRLKRADSSRARRKLIERAASQRMRPSLDQRSDLYSLSVMLFELIAARPPFQAKNSTALFAMHLATPAPRLSEIAPEVTVPEALETLLERGLAKDPAQRLASAKDYLAEVQALLAADWERRNATTAPRSARNLADAMPDFPAPRTKVFLPESSIYSVVGGRWSVVRFGLFRPLTTDH